MGAGLKKHDILRPKQGSVRGVLHQNPEAPLAGHARYWPADDFAVFVEHYWAIEWDFREPQLRETLPHPAVYLVLEHGDAIVGGVSRTRFSRLLQGRDRVFGVRFRPGGFRTFLHAPVSDLTDQVARLRTLFGDEAGDLETVGRLP